MLLAKLVTLWMQWNRKMLGFISFAIELPHLEKLYLNGNRLGRLPESIGNLENLIELKISNNRLIDLPESVGNLQKIQTLEIQDNRLRELPQSVSLLDFVETIDARRNRLEVIPILPQSQSLHSVFLGENKLTSVSAENLKSCSNLSILDLSDNNIRELDADFGKLFVLSTLDLRNNNLSNLPYTLGFIPSLNKIAVDGNPLRTIRRSVWSAGAEELKKYLRSRAPEGLAEQLEEEAAAASARLRKEGQDAKRAGNHAGSNLGCRGYIGPSKGIYRNKNGTVFDFIQDIRETQSTGQLDLHGRLLAEIPSELWQNLATSFKPQEVTNDHNPFFEKFESKLSTERPQGNKLQVVNLSNNSFVNTNGSAFPFPEWFHETFLDTTKMILSSNSLRAIPFPVVLLENLQSLDLSYNCLTTYSVEQAFSTARRYENSILRHLRTLNLSHNNLTSIPAYLNQFLDLQDLDIANNKIQQSEQAEESLAILTLRRIDISCNRLEDIPRSLLILPRLEELYLDNNNLKVIPPQLGAIDSLHCLGVQGNPQKAIAQSTILRGTGAVMANLSRRIEPTEKENICLMRENSKRQLAEVEKYEMECLELERREEADRQYERSIAPKITSAGIQQYPQRLPNHNESPSPVATENVAQLERSYLTKNAERASRQPLNEQGANLARPPADTSVNPKPEMASVEGLRREMQSIELKLEKGGMTSRQEQQLKRDLARCRSRLLQSQSQ